MYIPVVDDDEKVRTAVRLMVEDAGFEVGEAADGAGALRAFRLRQADVVVCDLLMPQIDGMQVIRALDHEFPGVKVIAMSGGGFKIKADLLPVARRLGAAEILHKPLDQRTLVATDRAGRARFCRNSGPAAMSDPRIVDGSFRIAPWAPYLMEPFSAS